MEWKINRSGQIEPNQAKSVQISQPNRSPRPGCTQWRRRRQPPTHTAKCPDHPAETRAPPRDLAGPGSIPGLPHIPSKPPRDTRAPEGAKTPCESRQETTARHTPVAHRNLELHRRPIGAQSRAAHCSDRERRPRSTPQPEARPNLELHRCISRYTAV